MKWLFTERYGFLDLIFILFVTHLFMQGMWFRGVIIAICLAVTAVTLKSIVMKPKKEDLNKLWMLYVRQDKMIDAIKEHRRIYNSSLKEAKDVIMEYKRSLSKNR